MRPSAHPLRSLLSQTYSTSATPSPDVHTVVIGAGVVGLAIARQLVQHIPVTSSSSTTTNVLIIEQEASYGQSTSARNSEVIHAGLYYPPGSLKAKTCVQGKALLYDYCESRGIPHARLGKLIVAKDDAQIPVLHAIQARAAACGVHDLQLLPTTRDVQHIEPYVRARAALLSPSSGIVDSHTLMTCLLADAESAGATLVTHSRVISGDVQAPMKQLDIQDSGSGHVTRVSCHHVVNAAGLTATHVARMLQGVRRDSIPQQYYAKGNYFAVQGRVPFHHLIYPVPVPGGLGTHLTLDLQRRAKVGPDVEWMRCPSDVEGMRCPTTREVEGMSSHTTKEVGEIGAGAGDGAGIGANTGIGHRQQPNSNDGVDNDGVDNDGVNDDGGAHTNANAQELSHHSMFEYAVDHARVNAFYDAVREYWPDLPDDALQPDYAGIRPKLVGPGEPAADFMVHGASEHGVQGLVNLYGIESPGLTASLALACVVEQCLM